TYQHGFLRKPAESPWTVVMNAVDAAPAQPNRLRAALHRVGRWARDHAALFRNRSSKPGGGFFSPAFDGMLFDSLTEISGRARDIGRIPYLVTQKLNFFVSLLVSAGEYSALKRSNRAIAATVLMDCRSVTHKFWRGLGHIDDVWKESGLVIPGAKRRE